MRQKTLYCIFFAAMVLFSMTACTKELRIDRYELALRLEQADDAYAMSPENILIDQEKQMIFYSLQQPDDCILTLMTDKTDRIQSLSITINREKWNPETTQKVFLPFSKAVLTAFCGNDTIAAEAITALGLNSPDTYTTDRFERAELDPFIFTVHTNELSNVIACDYGTKSIDTTD